MPTPDEFMTLGELLAACQSGDRKRALEAMRDQLARKIDAGPCSHCGGPRGEMAGMASTIKELRAVIDEIERIPNPAEVTFLDTIREQHGSRMPDSPDSDTPRKSQARKSGSRRPGAGGGSRPGPMAGNAG